MNFAPLMRATSGKIFMKNLFNDKFITPDINSYYHQAITYHNMYLSSLFKILNFLILYKLDFLFLMNFSVSKKKLSFLLK